MRRTIELRFRENQDTGEIGLEPMDSSDSYEPISYPLGLAHDILEHLNGFETVADEIIAHGAMYWLRYEGGYVPPTEYGRNITLQDIGSEWNNLFRAMETNGRLYVCEPQKLLDEHIEAELAEIIEHGREAIRSDFADGDRIETHLEMISERFADWFRKGYRLAEKRYGKAGRTATCGVFSEIIRYMENLFKHEELESAQASSDGIRVIVDTCKATVRFQRFGSCGSCGCKMEHKEETYDMCKNCSHEYA